MPSLVYTLTNTPTDLVTALGLGVGKTYSGQYNGNSIARFLESVTAPDIEDECLQTRPGDSVTIQPIMGEQIYAWLNTGHGYLIISEVL